MGDTLTRWVHKTRWAAAELVGAGIMLTSTVPIVDGALNVKDAYVKYNANPAGKLKPGTFVQEDPEVIRENISEAVDSGMFGAGEISTGLLLGGAGNALRQRSRYRRKMAGHGFYGRE